MLRVGLDIPGRGKDSGGAIAMGDSAAMSLKYLKQARHVTPVKGEVTQREAKATTLRKVLLARSCAMEGEDVV